MKAKIERAYVEVVPDEDPDTSYLDQDEFTERREEYRAGQFNFVGIRAAVEIRYETEQGGWIGGPTITTPGLWGVESDSDEDYLAEIAREEAEQLVDMLTALGFSERRANYARMISPTQVMYR